MVRDTFASIESTASQAEALLAQGRFGEAERHYRALAAQTHVIDYEYDDWLRRLGEIYRELGRPSEAGFVYLYLHYFEEARTAFASEASLADLARVFEMERRWTEAAELYSRAKMPVHTGVALDRAKRYAEAAKIWESLTRDPTLRDQTYEVALVHFNYGMALEAANEDGGAGRKALVESQRFLEQVADDFETRGERERAFDCYQILLKLGRESGQFENLAEGYLNCIRVLKEDNLKFYVLQYYEDFIHLALERGEFHAAATLYQQAAEFASRSGLPYDRHYQAKAAETWARCAEQSVSNNAPLELAENALLAAIGCYSSIGNYPAVRQLFERLTEMGLSDKKRDRYHRIAKHYADAARDTSDAPGFPEYLKQKHAYGDIWFVDLIEWELGGDPRKVAASIVGDLHYPDGIRRRALVIVLTLADAATRGEETDASTLERIAELLGELQTYAALSPLERLFEHHEPRVRRAAVRALRFLFFKRSFVLIRQALGDADETVVEAAIEALRGLHFPHAFNPLTRIYRESDDPRVRAVALESIGRIQSIEAGEFLLSVLRQEDGELLEVARTALLAMDNPDVLPILRQYQDIEPNPHIRETLDQLLKGSGL